MKAPPLPLRDRIARALAERHPLGMTAGQLRQMVLNSAVSGPEVHAALAAMVSARLLVEGKRPRRGPLEPLRVFIASDALAAGLGLRLALSKGGGL
jgi:hypothetical protein